MTSPPVAHPWTRLAGLVITAATFAAFSTPGAYAAGKAGQLTETSPAKPAPEFALTDINEMPATLSAFKGKPLIVNLWATWCGPCVKEMPSLVRLQAALKDKDVQIVAVSEDRGGKFVVDPFLQQNKITELPIYLDKTMQATKALRAGVMPTTVLIDAQGNEVARVFGDREWDSADSKAEIEKLFGLKG